jgi:leucyl aminopeptidase
MREPQESGRSKITFFGVDIRVTKETRPGTFDTSGTMATTSTLSALEAGSAVSVILTDRALACEWKDVAHAAFGADESRCRGRATWRGASVDVLQAKEKKGVGASEAWRKAVGTAATDWKSLGASRATLVLCAATPDEARALVSAAIEALSFALYRFEHTFGTEPMKVHERALTHVDIVVAGEAGAALEHLDDVVGEAVALGAAWQFARALGDRPANTLAPAALVDEVAARLAPFGVRARILDEDELAKDGFGGILAVGKGSANPPRLGIYEYAPAGHENDPPLVLVGKGVTFDTGGYSIKPKQHHNDMKYDMLGAAGVAAALEAIAVAKLPVRVMALLACAENMVSQEAQRPGDVYRAWNGKTVDVYNTDAEGRLLLADALAFAGTFKPEVVVDMATLTGGTLSIAGNMAAVACANDDALVAEIRAAGAQVGEKYLALEILPEAIADMKGLVSDYTNMNAKWSSNAMTMYAAAFLQEFVPEGVPWLHLDIAAVAYAGRENGYAFGPGANAYGARSLFHFVSMRTKALK